MSTILMLGFASGLPLYLTSRTLQAWMTVAGVNLTAIGIFSLVGLPYSLKFLWSPIVDRFSLPFLGRRTGWLFATQVALAAAVAAVALERPGSALQLVAITAFLIAFLSATQDIAVDAYRTDISAPSEVGAASGMHVLGYRIAMIVTGAGALILADLVSWPAVYVVMGLLFVLLSVRTWRVPEPTLRGGAPGSLRDAVVLPFVEFFDRVGTTRGIWIMLLVVMYRFGEVMIDNMTIPFLLQTGFSQTEVGIVKGGVGLAATIAGVLAGGAIISKIEINRSLWVFGILQVPSNLAYLWLAETGKNFKVMVAAIVVENFSVGLGTAALVGLLMLLCNPRFSATQYALLSSLIAIGRDVLASPSGWIASKTGWPMFFLFTAAAVLPGLALLRVALPRETPILQER
jgi:MFS transporter, PAT family, beta-lactamase induction signal transducer AmpG